MLLYLEKVFRLKPKRTRAFQKGDGNEGRDISQEGTGNIVHKLK